MLNMIKGRYGISSQMASFVEEANRMVEKYGWQDRTVAPYGGHADPIKKYIGWLADYDICTRGSQEHLVLLANGLANVMNAWERHELDKTVKCRILKGVNKGIVRMLEPWMAEMLIAEGAVEAI